VNKSQLCHGCKLFKKMDLHTSTLPSLSAAAFSSPHTGETLRHLVLPRFTVRRLGRCHLKKKAAPRPSKKGRNRPIALLTRDLVSQLFVVGFTEEL
jgi:hypothetical protein